jgi:hypothetical protein
MSEWGDMSARGLLFQYASTMNNIIPPPINWPPRYNWIIVKSGIKHHSPNPINNNHLPTLN